MCLELLWTGQWNKEEGKITKRGIFSLRTENPQGWKKNIPPVWRYQKEKEKKKREKEKEEKKNEKKKEELK